LSGWGIDVVLDEETGESEKSVAPEEAAQESKKAKKTAKKKSKNETPETEATK
jgi:hypothetical protein